MLRKDADAWIMRIGLKRIISIEIAACILMLLEAKFPGSEDLLSHSWKFQAQGRDLPAIASNAEKRREKACSELYITNIVTNIYYLSTREELL